MAESADFVVRYNDWSGGDFGVLDPSRAERNQFAGTNVIEYDSGLLGVRPGFKTMAVAWPGGTGTHTAVPGPLGFDVFGENLLITLGDKTWKIPFTAGTIIPVAFNAYPSAPTEFVRFAQGSEVLYSTANGVLYKHLDDGTTTAITTPQPLSTVVRWNYHLIGIDKFNPYRIWYSTVDVNGPQFDTWGANNFLDVGGNLPITAMKPLFNTLYCGKSDGWWAVSGILGQLSYVRYRVMGNGPPDQRQVTATTDNRILYWPSEAVPAWFNGERVYLDENQRIAGFSTVFAADTVVATPTGKRLMMLGELRDEAGAPVSSGLLMWDDSAWTSHVLAQPLAALVPQDVRNGTQLPDGVVFGCTSPTVVGDDVEIQSFSHDLDRPGHADDDWASPTDPGSTELVTGTVNLSAFYEPQGRQLLVRGVIVQFRKWASGVAGTQNRLEMQVVPLGRYDAGTIDSPIQVWQEASDRSATTGTDDSMRFEVGAQGLGSGFQIRFPQLRGVAIREVNVLVEARTKRL